MEQINTKMYNNIINIIIIIMMNISNAPNLAYKALHTYSNRADTRTKRMFIYIYIQ